MSGHKADLRKAYDALIRIDIAKEMILAIDGSGEGVVCREPHDEILNTLDELREDIQCYLRERQKVMA